MGDLKEVALPVKCPGCKKRYQTTVGQLEEQPDQECPECGSAIDARPVLKDAQSYVEVWLRRLKDQE